ncbi:U2-type spliceosomal complex subunit CWC25 [Aspergillus glaucus CBS 516.65]|uniref:CBF1-interacting co-repressor CIR N-terminal domain-containing protein n=1 Tax=Aspergillus glaucus CBS 516.65 TaxID=1160497 RepID=A0A1L9VBB9_ASPGL|nr:hypothetical protein ASPGLDRAFT_76537 [Aspergillus glaucus CBS 516.65]OJJ81226.1 hypothetical protein ASPGLDRAFT_76537 [Aspergillus glaucus CBS 516.65]
MGGGDLNLKKSWHPSLLRNQERVWSEEQKALEERKRIDQLRRERDEERQIQDLQRLQEDSGQVRQTQRVDWMYQAPSGATGHVAEEMEGYLLGKRRIDSVLLKGEETKKLERGADFAPAAGPGAGAGAVAPVNSRDMMTKVMADPLFEVKKREQAAYEAAVKESARKGKKVVDGGSGGDRQPEKGRERERDRDRGHRHRSRRYSDEDSHRHRTRRHRSRSSSPDHRRSYRSRKDDRDYRDDRDRRDRDRRDRDRREDRGRGRSRDERDRRDRDRRASSRHRDHDDRYHDRPRRDSYSRRSPSRRDRRPSPDGRDSESNGYRKPRDYDNRPRDSYRRDRNSNRPQPNGHANGQANNAKSKEQQDEERQRKLAEMQSNASDLETTRRKRIDEVTAMEERQREEDEKNRTEKGRFVGQLHRQLQEDSLDQRIQRSRGGLIVDKDE